MDILIKNMKMPKGARKLKIEIDSEGNVDIYSHEINGYYRLERRAIALPPHGDLIERDKAIDEMEYVSFDTAYNCDLAQEVLRDASVFLEAST